MAKAEDEHFRTFANELIECMERAKEIETELDSYPCNYPTLVRGKGLYVFGKEDEKYWWKCLKHAEGKS